MIGSKSTQSTPAQASSWRWWVSGLLLFATMINYLDRQTLANVAVRITNEYGLNNEQYGSLETHFGLAFACGSIGFGFLVDHVSVRWLYPCVLALWSAAGFMTASTTSYDELLLCRTVLGFFEAGHWPCALKTTQRLLSRDERTLGNSVLQSGASIGAIATPLIMQWMLAGHSEPGAWRQPFQVIAGVGAIWIVFWIWMMRRVEIEPEKNAGVGPASKWSPHHLFEAIFSRRFLVLLVVVACINVCWQLVRAWLPKFLQEGRGYTESQALYFNSVYYIATDVGCLTAGAVTLWLARRGWSIHASRCWVFGVCAILTSLTVLVSQLPHGTALLAVLLIVAAGSLGLFPCYYSFMQELSISDMGKVTGLLGAFAWIVSSPLQKLFGRLIDQTKSYDLGIALVGCVPLIGLAALLIGWRPSRQANSEIQNQIQ